MPTFIAAFFTITKSWKQPKCSSRMNKQTVAYTHNGILFGLVEEWVMIHTTTWMIPGNVQSKWWYGLRDISFWFRKTLVKCTSPLRADCLYPASQELSPSYCLINVESHLLHNISFCGLHETTSLWIKRFYSTLS